MNAESKLPMSGIGTMSIDDLPVFQQRWWVEIACGTALLNEVKVVEGKTVVGSLPYVVKRNKSGIKYGAFSDWTHISGPVVSQNLSEKQKAEIIHQLLAQLPRNVSLTFVCRRTSRDAELIGRAFKAAGFSHSIQTTYSQPRSAQSALSRISRKHAKHIMSADRRLDVIDIDADRFIRFYETNLKEAGKASYSHLDIAHDLIAEGCKRNPPQVRVIAARKRSEKTTDGSLDASSKEDILDSAIACVWDNERYYLWMITRRRDDDPAGKPHPDAGKLLAVKAMEHARSLGLIFDADGGSGWFYEKILQLPDLEICDVYERTTLLAGLVKKYPSLGTAAWLIYSRICMARNLLRGRRKERCADRRVRTALSKSS